MIYQLTLEEDTTIEQCCGWLDDQTVAMCLDVAIEKADEIMNPAIAEETLVKVLTKVIVRNRQAERRK